MITLRRLQAPSVYDRGVAKTRMWRDATAQKAFALIELARSGVDNRRPQPDAGRHAALGEIEQRLANPFPLMRWRYKKLIQTAIVFLERQEGDEIRVRAGHEHVPSGAKLA